MPENLSGLNDVNYSNSDTTNIALSSAYSNPQVAYCQTLILWNAHFLVLESFLMEDALTKMEDALTKKVKDYILWANLEKIKNSLLEYTTQLGLERKKREIENTLALTSNEIDGTDNNSNASCTCNLDTFRSQWVFTNFIRLLVLRVIRFFTVFNVADPCGAIGSVLKSIHPVTQIVFALLSWAYYLPRLGVNLAMMAKHTVPGPWMPEQEKKIGWSQRLKAQWDRRWFELLNDAVWCVVGLTTCFILVGALAPFAMYLIVALYTFDVINIVAKAYIENRRYNKLIKECSNRINYFNGYLSDKNCKEVTTVLGIKQDVSSSNCKGNLENLKENIEYQELLKKALLELKKSNNNSLKLSVGTAVGLWIGMILFIPAFGSIVPVVGAGIVLMTCFVFFTKRYVIPFVKNSYAPKEGLKLSQLKLFKEELDENDCDSAYSSVPSSVPSSPDDKQPLALAYA